MENFQVICGSYNNTLLCFLRNLSDFPSENSSACPSLLRCLAKTYTNVHQEVFSRQSLFLEITMILQKLPVIKTNEEKSIKQGQNIITQFLVSLKNKKDQLQK